jgi:hypothetical protein
MIDENLSPLQELEREAMTGDRWAVTKLVSAIREYRAACATLTELRCTPMFDTAIDRFVAEIGRIEQAYAATGDGDRIRTAFNDAAKFIRQHPSLPSDIRLAIASDLEAQGRILRAYDAERRSEGENDE